MLIVGLNLVPLTVEAQRGKIIKPATTPVLDPNGDTFVSETPAGFSNDGYNVDEFELKMFGIPIVGSGDSLADNQAGAKCGITDITVDNRGYGVYGVIDNNDNLVFRFRLGTDNPSVEAYSILIDTDGKMGTDDPNATPDNPGFEIDITLIKNQNQGVSIFNIDGIESCPTPLRTYGFDSHFQIAVADVVSCGNPDYFYDYYVPFSALSELFGITKDTELRFSAVTNTSATCAMAGKISDVAGVIDTQYNGCNTCAFLDLTSNQCPTSLNNLCFTCAGFQLGVTPKPTLNLPVKAGQNFVSGSLKDPDGTPLVGADIFIQVFDASDALQDRDTVQTSGDGSWLSTFTYILTPGDSVTARARALDRCSSAGLGSQASFTIVVVNVPPVISGATTGLTYTENDPPLSAQPALSILDPDNTVMEGATISLVTNYQNGQDVLVFTPTPGVTGSFNPASGSLTFSGTAPVAAYQDLLRSVAYQNTSDNPSPLPRTIQYQLFDGLDVSNLLSRVITVVPVNDPPMITGSAAQIQYTSGSLTLDNTLTLTDPDHTLITGGTVSITNNFHPAEDQLNFTNQLGITGTYSAATGILTLAGTATLADYTTALRTLSYSASMLVPTELTRRISFVVSDGTSNSLPFHKFVGITPVNYPPGFVDGSNNPITTIPFTTPEDTPLAGCVNVQDPNADPVSISGITLVSGAGSFALNGALCFTFTPGTDFVGPVNATITICDIHNACATATLEITVTPSNDPPVITGNPSVITYPGASVTVDNTLLVTDVDNPQITGGTVTIDGNFVAAEDVLGFTDQLGISGSYNPPTGILTLSGAASLADYSTALRSITYTNSFQSSLLTRRISFVVSDGTAISSPFQKFIEFNGNVNRPPFLVDGLGNPVTVLPFTTNEDTALADCISAVDPDGDPVTVTSISLSSGSGLISTTGGLCFQFIPGPNFNGTASATVSICDPSNACASGSIEITIDPVNDPPVVSGSAGLLVYVSNPVPVDNNITVGDVDNPVLVSATVAISGNYEPGKDILSFTNQLGITGVFDAGTGILTLTGSASLADYTTALRSITFSNSDQFPSTLTRTVTFVAHDGTVASPPFNRFIDVQQVNVAPRFTDGGLPVDTLYFTMAEDAMLSACVTASDANGDQVVLTGLQLLSGSGDFTLEGGLCFRFQPSLNFNGKVKAKITACDGASSSLCVDGGVVITILPVNDPPEITTNTVTVPPDQTTSVCLTVTDVEGDATRFIAGISQAGLGTVSNGASSGDLCFDYAPNPGAEGIDPVEVTVCEIANPASCSTKTIPVEIKYPNRPPGIIVNGVPGSTLNLVTEEDVPLVFCFESVDPDGDDVTLSQALNVAGGGLLESYQNIEFCFTFTPGKDFHGLAVWTITVCDDQDPSLCGTLTANITVTPKNDPPLALADTLGVLRHTVSKLNVLLNDTDVEGDSIMIASQPKTGPYHGQATVSTDGFITYTSDRYYRGIDSLTYEICDDGVPAGCSQAVVRIEIGDLPLRIYEGVSPNGDGVNDYWRMDGIDFYPQNVVRVFDRYNNLVYEIDNYNNEDRVWRGEANRGLARGKLPDGVYFYSIRVSNDIPSLSGFVILKMEK